MTSPEFEQAIRAGMRTAGAERARRRRDAAAAAFVPMSNYERMIDHLERDPDLPRKLGIGLEYAMYAEDRKAAIEAGRFDPAAWRAEQDAE